ncbi:MAG: hypothetical protein KGH66_00635 [Candidatus Micrarchaeota archaeon]|nr:hypothetical protein [Candidatus Micrarchaeota archaeon]
MTTNKQMMAEATENLYEGARKIPNHDLLTHTVGNLKTLWDSCVAPQYNNRKPAPLFWRNGVDAIAQNLKDHEVGKFLHIDLDLYVAQRAKFTQFVMGSGNGTPNDVAKRDVVVMAGFTTPVAERLRVHDVIDDCVAQLSSQSRRDMNLLWLTQFVKYGEHKIDQLLRKEIQRLDDILSLAFVYNNIPGATVRMQPLKKMLDRVNTLLRGANPVSKPFNLVKGYLEDRGFDDSLCVYAIEHLSQKTSYMGRNVAVYRQTGTALELVSETYK